MIRTAAADKPGGQTERKSALLYSVYTKRYSQKIYSYLAFKKKDILFMICTCTSCRTQKDSLKKILSGKTDNLDTYEQYSYRYSTVLMDNHHGRQPTQSKKGLHSAVYVVYRYMRKMGVSYLRMMLQLCPHPCQV